MTSAGEGQVRTPPFVEALASIPKPVMIAFTILGFVTFWPIGLVLLSLMLWGGHWGGPPWARQGFRRHYGRCGWSSGNAAFDAYRQATLERLEEDAKEFKAFLQRLREAKDQEEFDRFMAERRSRNGQQPPAA